MTLSSAHGEIGSLYQVQGKIDMALESHEASVAVVEKQVANGGGCAKEQQQLAVGYSRVAVLLNHRKDYAGAKERFLAAMSIAEKLLKENPDNRLWQSTRSLSYYHMGQVLSAAGSLEEARSYFARCAESYAAQDQPDADASYFAARCCARINDAEKAFDWLNKSIDSGFKNAAGLATVADLESLRSDPGWKAMKAATARLWWPVARSAWSSAFS